MQITKLLKISFKCLIVYFIFSHHINALENKIEFKVNNQIITTIDIGNEVKYLTALNPKLTEMDKDKIKAISTKSLIREKIKKIEIQKIKKNLQIEDVYLSKLLEKNYRKINIKSEQEFIDFLANKNLIYDEFKEKIIIEALWNELIFFKFKSKININEDELKKEIKSNKEKDMNAYNLSEIVFNLKDGENIEDIFKLITQDIDEKGFENAAAIYGVSSTSNMGGKLGWIEATSLNEKLRSKIEKLKIGEFSNPQIIPGGFLIIKLNDTKKIEKKINFDEELKKLIKVKSNEQLNQFSIMYFNKIRKDINVEKI